MLLLLHLGQLADFVRLILDYLLQANDLLIGRPIINILRDISAGSLLKFARSNGRGRRSSCVMAEATILCWKGLLVATVLSRVFCFLRASRVLMERVKSAHLL